MQKLPIDTQGSMHDSIESWITVDQVSQHGKSSIRQMYSDLVHPSGLNFYPYQRALSQNFMSKCFISPAFCLGTHSVSKIDLHLCPIEAFVILLFQWLIDQEMIRESPHDQC